MIDDNTDVLHPINHNKMNWFLVPKQRKGKKKVTELKQKTNVDFKRQHC